MPRTPYPPPTPEENLEWAEKADREFFDKLLDPKVWVSAADDLLLAASIIRPHVELYWKNIFDRLQPGADRTPPDWTNSRLIGALSLLVAYALENLLKALIVKRDDGGIATPLAKKYHARAKKRRGKQRVDAKADDFGLPPDLAKHDLNELANLAVVTLDRFEADLLERLTQAVVWSGRYRIPRGANAYASKGTTTTSSDFEIADRVILRIRHAIVEFAPEKGE